MRIRTISNMILLLLLLMYVMIIQSVGVNIVTLPWLVLYATVLVLGLIFAKYGKYILAVMFKAFGISLPVGEGEVTPEGFYIVEKYENPTVKERVLGMAFLKLIPLKPVEDMKKEEVLQLIANVEATLYSIPEDVEMCIMKSSSIEIDKLIKRLENELNKYAAKADVSKGGRTRYERKVAELREELDRLRKARPVMGIIYFAVRSTGETRRQVIEDLKNKIEIIKRSAYGMNAEARPLNILETYDLLEVRATKYTVHLVE